MAKKLTKEQFIEKCVNIHGDTYDYSKTEYINTRTKIKLICKIHGEFEISPDNHIGKQKQGCSKCGINKNKLTILSSERLNSIKKIHNNKYEYNDLNITNGEINITCPEHGVFTQIIYHHEKGHGCPLCAGGGFKLLKLNEERLDKLKDRHNNYYTYSDLKINNGYINIICPKHGKFTQQLFFHENGGDCKKCALEKRSIKVKEYNILNPKNPIIDGEKFCIDCGEIKSLDLFPLRNKNDDNSHRNQCSDCWKDSQTNVKRKYRQAHKRELLDYDKKYRKQRMATDPLYKAKMIARDVTRKALTRYGYSKNSRTYEILGCSYEDFKTHIESLFLEGMNWDNRSEWHIDHIIPLSFGITEEECLKLSNYKNLRPIWGEDNLEKSDTITETTDIYHNIISSRK